MEEELTLEELYLLIDEEQKREHKDRKFMAALKGVDLDDGNKDDGFDKVKQKAAAALAGKDEDEYVLDMIGIEIEADD